MSYYYCYYNYYLYDYDEVGIFITGFTFLNYINFLVPLPDIKLGLSLLPLALLSIPNFSILTPFVLPLDAKTFLLKTPGFYIVLGSNFLNPLLSENYFYDKILLPPSLVCYEGIFLNLKGS